MRNGQNCEEELRFVSAQSALLLVQFAACRAEIGQFAKRALRTPQAAARSYAAAAWFAGDRRPREL